MFSRSVSGTAAKQQLAVPAGVVHSREGAGEHLQHQAVGEQVVGERGEFGNVAAEPLHLVHRG